LCAVLIHDSGELVEALFDDELHFQECLNRALPEQAWARINDPVRRSKKPDVSRYVLSTAIADLEAAVVRLFR
jgi:hypothetical protein